MSNLNSCEKDHQDPEGFLAAVAEEGTALRIAEALGATSVVRLARTPTIFDLAIGCIPVAEQADADQNLLYERALNCARSVMNGTCERYQLAESSSLTKFQLEPKGVA
jgi:hypothetical protein